MLSDKRLNPHHELDQRGQTPRRSEDPSVSGVDSGAPKGVYLSTPLEESMGAYLPTMVAYRLLNYGRILLLAWYMSQQQFGLLTMVMLVANLLTPLCSLGLNEAVTRYAPQYERRGSLAAFSGKAFYVLVVVTTFSVAFILIFSSVLGDVFFGQAFGPIALRAAFSEDAPRLAQFSATLVGLMAVFFFLIALMKGLRMFRAVAWMELSHSVLFFVGSLAAIALGRLSALSLTAIYALSLLLSVSCFGPGLRRSMGRWQGQLNPLSEGNVGAKLLRFSVWTMLAGVTWQLLLSYPALFLNKIEGHASVAVFNAVRQFGQFVLIAAVSVSMVVMTTVTKTWESQGRAPAERQLSLAFRGTCFGLLVLCAAFALAKNVIIKMFRAEYSAGAEILPLHLLFFLLAGYLAFLPGHFHLREKTRNMFWPWVAGVATNILLAYRLSGAKLAEVMESAWWRAAGPKLSFVFTTGFADEFGLGSAAWCGVIAMAVALVFCLVLVRAGRTSLDRGTYIVIFSSVLLATTPWLLAAGTFVLILLALRTELIFGAAERRRIIGYVVESLRHAPPLKVWGRRGHGGS